MEESDRITREIRMFKSICVKLIMADTRVNLDTYVFNVENCQCFLTQFKTDVKDHLVLVADDGSIMTKLFKTTRPTCIKTALSNLIERSLTVDMIAALSTHAAGSIVAPKNLAEVCLRTFLKIQTQIQTIRMDTDAKRTFVKQIIDEMEQYLLCNEKEDIIKDLRPEV